MRPAGSSRPPSGGRTRRTVIQTTCSLYGLLIFVPNRAIPTTTRRFWRIIPRTTVMMKTLSSVSLFPLRTIPHVIPPLFGPLSTFLSRCLLFHARLFVHHIRADPSPQHHSCIGVPETRPARALLVPPGVRMARDLRPPGSAAASVSRPLELCSRSQLPPLALAFPNTVPPTATMCLPLPPPPRRTRPIHLEAPPARSRDFKPEDSTPDRTRRTRLAVIPVPTTPRPVSSILNLSDRQTSCTACRLPEILELILSPVVFISITVLSILAVRLFRPSTKPRPDTGTTTSLQHLPACLTTNRCAPLRHLVRFRTRGASLLPTSFHLR